MKLVDPDHDPTVMPSADDPSETLEESIERLRAAIGQLCAQRDQIRRTLSAFYMAPISASSLQPVLLLAEQLDPSLKTSLAENMAQRFRDSILTVNDAPF